MRVVVISSLFALAVGCGPELELIIDAPGPDTVVYETETVDLSASATLDGEPVDVDVDWSADGWSASGASITVTDLPVGTYTLTASAQSDDLSAEATVDITVEPIPDPEPYGGTQSIQVEAGEPGSPNPFDYPCTHKSLSLELDFAGNIRGSGTCDVFGEYTFAYLGTVVDGAVTGTMELTSTDTGGEKMDFTGTMQPDGSFTVSFDNTWTNDEGTGYLRVYGSTTATPE